MRRFYTDQLLAKDTVATLCDGSYHHWVRVLRANVGDGAILFNGRGGEYHAVLTHISKKSAQVKVGAYYPDNRTNPFSTMLALVMSKGERMDYALTKATELGVTNIQLLTSERCEVRLNSERLSKKLANWQAQVIAACEQCGLNLVPQVLEPISVNQFIERAAHELKLVLAPTSDGKPNAPLPQQPAKDICLLIGAEGGLTAKELDFATQHGFAPWCLGARILRTETAPVVSMSMILGHFFYSGML